MKIKVFSKNTSLQAGLMPFLVLLAICWSSRGAAQVKPATSGADTSSKPGEVHIIHADRLGFKKQTDSSQIRFASGHVEIHQNDTKFYCDSVAINSITRIMEAYGHVHINDNDSVQIYADFMRYRGQERTAYLKNNVRLTDGKGTLTTTDLDYDLNTKIAVYAHQGKLVNGQSVLTSIAGTYYGDTRDVQFNKDVKLVDPDYTMTTDTLLYNTYTKIATFTVPTLIKKGPFRSIHTTDGYYDLIHKNTYLGKRPTIIDSSSTLIADEVAAEDSTGFAEARGNVVYKDTAQGTVILCNDLKTSREGSSFLATVNPVAIIKQAEDSIFIAADTLYSARFPDSTLQAADSAQLDSTRDAQGQAAGYSGAADQRLATDSIAPAAAVSPSADSATDTLSAEQSAPSAREVPADGKRTDSIPATADTTQRGFHKVGKVFIWGNDTTQAAAKSPAGKTPPEEKVGEGEDSERKGLFDIFRKKNKEQHAEPGTVPLGDRDTVPGKLESDQAPKKEKEKEKKSIFNIFKKKDADAGKRQPSIIDSVKAGKAKPVIDSAAAKSRPGIDFSANQPAGKNDSIRKEDNKSRFLEAYYNVRIFSDSLQGIGDSLYYSAKDSLFQLFKNPTIWTTSNHQISQISGDTINMRTANNKPQYIRVANNAIMISQADTLHSTKTDMFFNQMSGRQMEAWFQDGQLDSLSAEGNAKGIFYGLDEGNKYIGVTQQESRILNFYFINKELQRIVGKNDVVGRVYPMQEVDHEKIRLKGFEWLEDKRPKSKFELLAH